MSEPLENLYFNWLCAKVVDIRETSPGLSYWKLLKVLHTTEFVWLLSGDDNRAEDGKELRTEFLLQGKIPDDPDWRLLLDCSVLEMFVAFSRRAAFMCGDRPTETEWFWIFIENLGLKDCNDANFVQEIADDKLYSFIWRTYDYSGTGGLFPMKNAAVDQRDVELWYQFCDYLVDHELIS